MALIAGSIREYGFTNPVLVDGENGIIAGHGRVLAARKLGLASVPVIELGHLSESQKRAYVLADNRLAEAAGWDKAMLALEAADLCGAGRRPRHARLRGRRDRRAAERRRRRPARGGDARAAGGAGLAARRPLAARPPPAALRQRHRARRRGAPARRGAAAPDGDRSALWRDLRPGLAQPGGASTTKRTGKVLNDDRADWREAWALFPGRGRLRLARGAARHHRRRQPRRLRLRDPQPDHLGQGAAGALPRRLPLAARAVLVRGPRQGQGALERRPQADRRSGRSRAATRTRRRCTAPRSRSRRCAGRC